MGVERKFRCHCSLGPLSSESPNNLDSMADLVRASLRCPGLFFVSGVTRECRICGNRR